jgi:hypothetical protein
LFFVFLFSKFSACREISIDQTGVNDTSILVSGQLPNTFSNFPELYKMEIREAKVSGTIPSSLFSTHPKINAIGFHNNQISGTIPSTLSPMLQYLFVAHLI